MKDRKEEWYLPWVIRPEVIRAQQEIQRQVLSHSVSLGAAQNNSRPPISPVSSRGHSPLSPRSFLRKRTVASSVSCK